MIIGSIIFCVVVIAVLIWRRYKPSFDVIEDGDDGGEWLIMWYNVNCTRDYKVLWRWS